MHPELLRALARARHHDLLSAHQTRGHPSVRQAAHVPPFTRSRQRLGSLLMWAGARLTGDQQSPLELVEK